MVLLIVGSTCFIVDRRRGLMFREFFYWI